ncbi:LacI family DNA-binding transcriptional regulator [Marinovum sp.]|uniref:LacI family DNA-binding transcriptional regulator n=1 Tax=Marinovum sp. TaxID=2024839 RepID=UPI003A8CFAAE
MNKRATLKDIAKATGVHVSTVSRALDPNRATPISDDVVKKVQDAARELGYRPNRAAYSLRTNRTMTIGVMIPDITNTLFPPIVRGIESVMEPKGYASIMVNTDSQRGREVALLGTLQERGVDGIIHTAALRNEPSIVEAAASGLPIVTLNRKIEGTEIPYVINDEQAGIAAVFAHLTSFGHRQIAHIAGPADLSTGKLRREGFLAAARAHGLDPSGLAISEALRFDEEEGERCAHEILDAAPGTTAILGANDRLALGALRALGKRGLTCPGDVSLTGFNDMPLLDLIPPGLTTVRIQQFEAGQTAARHLLSLIRGDVGAVPQRTILPVELIRRASVAAPRRAARG